MNPATTPKVQYTYADGADNTVRPMALVYPNGREAVVGSRAVAAMVGRTD